MLTADAGSHWSSSALPGDVGDFPIVRVLSAKAGWAGNVAGDAVVLFRTTDGGRNWEESRTRTPSKPTQLTDLFFMNPSRGWLIVDYNLHEDRGGNGSYVFGTVDGGRTWARLVIQAIAGRPAYWVRFLSANLGFIFVDRGDDNGRGGMEGGGERESVEEGDKGEEG